ncbi:MAG: hypothetical protein UV59_C0002G0004 [Candidatus Gottesmanbacteria bacterium GW2011_GWA1_43_11]|uniref:Uncharacterized protein n=1 Tax=Candidatus Gottesmanbacteria bacterium GW2011_GWA1_43_11 TaxID=1618436 RepID=A0A0G1CKV7_9BACT|nr:MAG: hypothetical protein UV59_C0002G0004 [Candidatus Gottesmanbacteria bacterium GW2011_GWA1_43_11]
MSSRKLLTPTTKAQPKPNLEPKAYIILPAVGFEPEKLGSKITQKAFKAQFLLKILTEN